MDQSDLRAWEAKCIQEEPPRCQAACPIHVDIRTFMAKMAAGDFNAAWTVLTRTMPLPHIICHICDHPCETQCLRNQAGDPLAIHLLEESCMALCDQRMRPSLIRAKDKKIAVMGSSLDGLTVAWDLSRKGYGVTLFHADDPETFLVKQFEDALPQDAWEADTALLKKFGVTFTSHKNTGSHPLSADRLKELLTTFDGVYVSMGTEQAQILSSWTREQSDPLTLAGPMDGLYTGGWADPFSPIQAIADGRKAAVSLDRYATKVSLTASREKEGAGTTRLHTSLAGVQAMLRIPASSERYTPEEATAEAARCLQCQCLECVKVCPYLEHYKGYPKTYARQIHNNAAIVKGLHLSNPLINSCSLCGLCQEVCPEDFSMADLCLSARKNMVAEGKMPLSAHDFALQDMEFSNSGHFAMVRHQPGHTTSRYLFFPGCQICSSRPGHTKTVYTRLSSSLEGGVALMLGCCGAPATWAGRTDLAEECTNKLRQTWETMGRPTIILACSSCLAEFRAALPDLPVVSLWTILDEQEISPDLDAIPAQTVSVIDPCTARHEAKVQQAVRSLLNRIGCTIEELELSGSLAECCGFGGLQSTANPDLAGEIVAKRQSRLDLPAVAYCAMCRDRLGNETTHVTHLLDFFLPLSTPDNLYRGTGPSLSERRENRARLKKELEKEIWHTDPAPREPYESIHLVMDREVRSLLEQRRILDTDLQQVIHHAETTKRAFINQDNGHILAGLRPVRVTYWVEYTREDNAFRIHSAYTHRMRVTGTDSLGDHA